MAKDDSLKRLGDFISQLFPAQGNDIEKWIPMFKKWKSIVGEGLDCHSRAREINKGMLLVDVDHPAWMNLFQMNQEKILDKLKKNFPEFKIISIRLRLVSRLDLPIEEPTEVEQETKPSSNDLQAPEDLQEVINKLFKTIEDNNKTPKV